jgi:hypothetical protein
MHGHVLIPVGARLTNGVPISTGDVIATTRPGSSTTVEVAITGPASTYVLRGSLIVAVPGSGSGAGEPAHMPPRAAIRAENQLAEGDPVTDAIARGQRLTVTFQTTEPGTYPVFFIARVRFSENQLRDSTTLDSIGRARNWAASSFGNRVHVAA